MTKTAAMVTMPNCVWCDKAVTLLTSKGYDLVFISVTDHAVRDFLRAGGFKTVPQIFLDGKHIGGYAELEALYTQNTDVEGG